MQSPDVEDRFERLVESVEDCGISMRHLRGFGL